MWARAIVISVAVLPWLALVPFGGAPGIATGALAIACALHGWGLLVARPSVLAIWFGVALVIGLGGIAMMLGIYNATTQAIVVFGGVALHTGALALDFGGAVERTPAMLRDARWWLVPVGALAVLGAFTIVGSAGDVAARAFDDDGHVLGALRQLADTGALGDPIGYPRVAGLGGNLAILALGGVLGDLHHVRAIDALALVLVLALAISRIRPRGAYAAIWATLLVVVIVALPIALDDPAPAWLACGLTIALFAAIHDGASAIAIGSLAGALVALRLELAPLAAIGLAAAWWPSREARRATILLGAAAATVAPYLVARAIAWSHVPDAVHLVVVHTHGGLALHLAIAAGVMFVAASFAVLLTTASRALALGVAATLGTIAGSVFGPASYAARFAWPVVVALVIVAVVEIARRGRTRAVLPFVIVMLAGIAVYEGQSATGRYRWVRRYLDLAEGVGYVAVVPASNPPAATDYTVALAMVPEAASVAVWVAHPESLDHARHRIFDLRTPRVPRARLPALLDALHPGYLLVEDDTSIAAERPNLFARGGLRLVQVQ